MSHVHDNKMIRYNVFNVTVRRKQCPSFKRPDHVGVNVCPTYHDPKLEALRWDDASKAITKGNRRDALFFLGLQFRQSPFELSKKGMSSRHRVSGSRERTSSPS